MHAAPAPFGHRIVARDGTTRENTLKLKQDGKKLTGTISGHAIAETCARNHALLAVRPGCSVAVSRPCRHIEGSNGSDCEFAVSVGLPCYSIGIAKASSLNFTNWSFDRRLG